MSSRPPRRGFFCLPRRDLLLLPLLSLMTVVALFGTAELGSRLLWQAYGTGECMQPDARLGVKWTPHCTARVKNLETTPAVYRFNECGFRSTQACSGKPAGTLRVAAIGSSGVFGYWLDIESTFPERLAAALGRGCPLQIESQNLGLPGATPAVMASLVDDALALHSDIVMVGVSASDIFDDARVQWQTSQPTLWARLLALVKDASHQSRFVAVARHYLYENRSHYLQAMVMRGEGRSMTGQMDPGWEQSFQHAEHAIGEMATKLQAAGVPLVLVYLPDRVQASLFKQHSDFPELQPHALRDRLKQVAQRDGLAFVDPTQEFEESVDPASLFYAADGHMTAEGHARVAEAAYRTLQISRPGLLSRCETGNPPALTAAGLLR